jgi:hypothetical protein
VRQDEDGAIVLEDSCPVEDAEPLLQMLQATPASRVDWRRCQHLHTAVLQVIVAIRPTLIGECGDPWVREWIGPTASSSKQEV